MTIPWMMQEEEGAACMVGGQHCTTTREGKGVEQVSMRGPRHKRILSLTGSIGRGGMLSEEGEEEEKEGHEEGEERDRAGSML